MWFERTGAFKADWKSLSPSEREIVRAVLPAFNAAADDVAAHKFDRRRWPKSLRVHDIENAPGIWSVTFNFVSPDIRATFEWASNAEQPTILWRRLGRHDIFNNP